jgi:hypothetical protein
MSYTVIYPQVCVTRQLYKDVLTITDDNEFVWEPDGKEEIFYEVSIRLEAVEQMARKAAGNAGQVSQAGPLRVRVLKRVPVTSDNDKAAEAAYNPAVAIT